MTELAIKMHEKSVRAENVYRDWISKNDEARKEVNDIIRCSRMFTNTKARVRYLKREKQDFDRKWIAAYGRRER